MALEAPVPQPSPSFLRTSGHSTAALALDARTILKAFRIIGGLDGIQENELREWLNKLRDVQTRKELLKNLHDMFISHDINATGVLDVIQFEMLIKSSTLMEQAIYDLMERMDEDEDQLDSPTDSSNYLFECVVLPIIVINAVLMSISIDNSPDWFGWRLLELCAVIVFLAEMVCRLRAVAMVPLKFSLEHWESSKLRTVLWHGLSDFPLMDAFDVLVTIVGGIGVIHVSLHGEANSLSTFHVLRLFLLARLCRVVKVIFSIGRNRIRLQWGMLTGFVTVSYSIALLSLLMFVWGIFIRHNVTVVEGNLNETFPNVGESMVVVFRCIVLNANGACMDQSGVPLYTLLSDNMGWLFKIPWLLSEVFISLGLLNVVNSVFVVQAMSNEHRVQHEIDKVFHREDKKRLRQLDKLLRTLTHPQRKRINPKDRNAARVAEYIQKKYPQAAAKIPDMPVRVLNFAEEIKESKESYQNAMNIYEAQEVEDCKVLNDLPSAQTYLVQQEEALLLDSRESVSGCMQLGLGVAPTGAVEVVPLQQLDELTELLKEAEQVQQYVKSIIWPQSEWACKKKSGLSGDIWQKSAKLCDEAVDPGPKGWQRIKQKVDMKYGGRYERNRDYSRLGFIYNTVGHLREGLKQLLAHRIDSSEGIQVVCIENRFACPTQLGWRDMTILLKVRVPKSHRCHVMEIQLQLRGLMEVRNRAHDFYEQIRGILPEEAVHHIIDKLTNDTTLDLRITRPEWLQCLKNKEVKRLLNELNIPEEVRQHVIDVADADGSGTVTTLELREGMMMCRGEPQTHDVVDARLKVRDMQQWLQNKLVPWILMLHNTLASKVDPIGLIPRQAGPVEPDPLQVLVKSGSSFEL